MNNQNTSKVTQKIIFFRFNSKPFKIMDVTGIKYIEQQLMLLQDFNTINIIINNIRIHYIGIKKRKTSYTLWKKALDFFEKF